ncbi:MAG: SDR family oxidoreductase [Oscillospiraceae bacterium]|nr:SDR family oxidoreductase [Oscillospiraceae bacterium]
MKVLVCQADGGIEEDVRNVIEKTVAEFGRLDILVNNAMASASGKMLVEHSKEDFDIAIFSGLYATFFYMKHAFPYLKESQGSVINFASGAGLSGKVGQSSYAAAKEGIRGMTRSTANEWGQYNINCNVVCPLVMTDKLAQWKEEYPEVYAKTIQGVPLGRFGDAEKDIGRLCVFLASEDASFITGETITIQGGVGMRP